MQRAEALAPDVNLELIIVSYWMSCWERKIQPTNSHWMKWVIKEQKDILAAREEAERKRALEERSSKPWYEKDLKF